MNQQQLLALKKCRMHETSIRGETYDDITHHYTIEFYDSESAKKFYDEVKDAISVYATSPKWRDLPGYLLQLSTKTCINARNFPVFMAAFTILAACSERYGVTQEALAQFRANAPLGALPDPTLIIENSDPGTLVPKHDGSGHWAMSSVLKSELKSRELKAVSGAAISSTPVYSDRLDLLARDLGHGAAGAGAGGTFFSRAATSEALAILFLEQFSVDTELLKGIKLNDMHFVCAIEFPRGTDLGRLTILSALLNERGFPAHVTKAHDGMILKFGPSIVIKRRKAELESWLEAQSSHKPTKI